MNAYVKTNNGTFPNLNFYMAWEGFNTMGYSVTLFEEKDIDTLDITTETPVFAGVTIFRKVIDKLGVNYPDFDCYPDILKPYYKRDIRKSTLGEERKKFNDNPIPVFVKPIKPKEFIGNVWSSILNLIPLANKNDDVTCYVSNPINILSEFRVYVNDGEILGVKHYHGDWTKVPSKEFVNEVVKAYKNSPISYGIDIGVNNNEEFVVEVNDGCNLGNYGIDAIHYGEMIVSRWFDIMADGKITNYITKELEYHTERDKERSTNYTEIYTNRFFKPSSYSGRTYKTLLVDEQREKLRTDSMKKFVEESLKEIGSDKSKYDGSDDIIEEPKQ